MPFAKWLEWWLGEIKPSQSSMLYDDEGKLLVDHILRFESLEDDYNQLCVELGIPFTNLPVLKKTDNRDYKKLYNQFLRELVKSHLNADIDNFAYSF